VGNLLHTKLRGYFELSVIMEEVGNLNVHSGFSYELFHNNMDEQ
jgi:hypothetical protein